MFKHLTLVVTLALVSTFASANIKAFQHPDIDPDLLMRMFIDSELVECYTEGPCRYINDGEIYTPPKDYKPEPGLHVIFPEQYTDEQIKKYTPQLTELYKGLINDVNKQMLPEAETK